MSKTALIAGSTGLVGSSLLNLLLNNDQYSKVIVLVRKPLDISHARLEQVVYEYDRPFGDKIRADDVYCCLGTTIGKAGSKDAFRRVDFEYPLQIAQLAFANGTKRFAIVTAIGSDEKSFFFYNRVKGEVETELKKIPFEGLYIFRPSMLLGNRAEYRFGEEVGKVFMKLFDFLMPPNTKAIEASNVAQAMITTTLESRQGIFVINSGDMQHFTT
jgi:uncharacterized protein YbjT (DUF2867 family)